MSSVAPRTPAPILRGAHLQGQVPGAIPPGSRQAAAPAREHSCRGEGWQRAAESGDRFSQNNAGSLYPDRPWTEGKSAGLSCLPAPVSRGGNGTGRVGRRHGGPQPHPLCLPGTQGAPGHTDWRIRMLSVVLPSPLSVVLPSPRRGLSPKGREGVMEELMASSAIPPKKQAGTRQDPARRPSHTS